MAQPADRFDQVVALAGELDVLLLDLAQFLLGEEIDRAEALALAVDALQPAFDIGDRR